jgi:deoxyribodipyrimidine photolyase
MEEWFANRGTATATFRDHLLIEPHELHRGSTPGSAYQVYLPFARRWLEIMQQSEVLERIEEQDRRLTYLKNFSADKLDLIFRLNWRDLLPSANLERDLLTEYLSTNQRKVTVPIPPPEARLHGLRSIHFSPN